MHTINYNYVLDYLKLNTLHEGQRYYDVLFIRNLYNGFITCSSLLETVGIRVPIKNLTDFNVFHTSISRRKRPSDRRTLAANEIRNRPDG
jgi:hypothetical protein